MLARRTFLALGTALLTSCGSPPEPGPFILANVCHGLCSDVGAADLESVLVCTDSSCGTPITNAVVEVNGTSLTWAGSYQGSVPVPEGSTVNLDVTIGALTYGVTATQFTTAPTITEPTVTPPASSATWPAASANTLSWTPGAPTAGASYVLDFAYFDGAFLQEGEVPITRGSMTFGPNFLSMGSGWVAIGIATATTNPIPIPNTAAQSGLYLSLYSQPVPLTVQ